MPGLTISQIADFNHRDAFARVRTGSAREVKQFTDSLSNASFARIKTNNLSESYSLLAGVGNRLGMVRANLSTMLDFARQGTSVTNELDRDELIGQMRSLSGGIDDIVDQTLWKEQKTLDGRTLDVSLTTQGGGASKQIKLESFYTSDEEGFDLTEQPTSAKADIFYDYYSAYRNQQSGLVGLDISKAYHSAVDAAKSELETGTYSLEIEYKGPDSAITVKTLEGLPINTVTGVDLSGTGQELVDLEVGVTLSIEKEQFLESIDKYDYQNEGSVTLYAKMDYQRVFQHELHLDGFEQYTDRNLDVNYKKTLTDSLGGSLEIESLNMSGVKAGNIEFATGNYSLRVNYQGEDSSVAIYNNRGILQYLDHQVDLSGSDKVKIDTGKGVAFTIDNTNFTDQSGQMVALFDYEAEENRNQDFDFTAYAAKIEEAIDRLDTDLEAVYSAQDEILQINSYQNSSAYSQSAATSSAALIGGLLSSYENNSASSIFGASSANAQLGLVANAIFQGTSAAMAVQADLTSARVSKTFSA